MSGSLVMLAPVFRIFLGETERLTRIRQPVSLLVTAPIWDEWLVFPLLSLMCCYPLPLLVRVRRIPFTHPKDFLPCPLTVHTCGFVSVVMNVVEQFLSIVLFTLLGFNILLHVANLLDMFWRFISRTLPNWLYGVPPPPLKLRVGNHEDEVLDDLRNFDDDESSEGSQDYELLYYDDLYGDDDGSSSRDTLSYGGNSATTSLSPSSSGIMSASSLRRTLSAKLGDLSGISRRSASPGPLSRSSRDH